MSPVRVKKVDDGTRSRQWWAKLERVLRALADPAKRVRPCYYRGPDGEEMEFELEFATIPERGTSPEQLARVAMRVIDASTDTSLNHVNAAHVLEVCRLHPKCFVVQAAFTPADSIIYSVKVKSA